MSPFQITNDQPITKFKSSINDLAAVTIPKQNFFIPDTLRKYSRYLPGVSYGHQQQRSDSMFPTVVPVHAVCNRLISDIYVKRDMHHLNAAGTSKSRPRSVLVITTSDDFSEADKRSKCLTQLLCDLPALRKQAEQQTGDHVTRIDIRAA